MAIKLECLLAVVLLAAPVASFAGESSPPPVVEPNVAHIAAAGAKTIRALESLIRDVQAESDRTKQCFDLEASLRADLAKKKSQLASEYGAGIPASFNDLLWKKSDRITKQHKTCFLQYEELGRQFAALDATFGTVEPKSLNVKKQRAMVDEEKKKYLLMMPTAKPYNKAPKAKTGE